MLEIYNMLPQSLHTEPSFQVLHASKIHWARRDLRLCASVNEVCSLSPTNRKGHVRRGSFLYSWVSARLGVRLQGVAGAR
jgi:hypothetical protein